MFLFQNVQVQNTNSINFGPNYMFKFPYTICTWKGGVQVFATFFSTFIVHRARRVCLLINHSQKYPYSNSLHTHTWIYIYISSFVTHTYIGYIYLLYVCASLHSCRDCCVQKGCKIQNNNRKQKQNKKKKKKVSRKSLEKIDTL